MVPGHLLYGTTEGDCSVNRKNRVLTSKERMRTAMSGGVPDCVPVMPQICPPYAIRSLGLDFEPTLIELLSKPEMLNRLDYDCAKKYGVDGMRLMITPDPIPAGEIVAEGGTIWRIDAKTRARKERLDLEGGGGLIPVEEAVLIADEKDVDKLPMPSCQELISSGKLDSARETIRDAGESMFMAAWAPSFTVEYLTVARGKAQAMIDIVERPQFAHHALAKATDISIQAALALAAVGIDAVMIGETFGGVIGPRLFEEFCLPYMRRFVEALRPRGVLVYVHTCGNATRLLETLADTGAHCIEPLDPLGGVSVADAKRRIGKRVALMGGVHTVKLAQGTLREVEADCQRCLREGAPGGGYILACGDMLPTETAQDKVHAMVQAAHRFSYA